MKASGSVPTPVEAIDHRTFVEFFAGVGLMRMGLEKDGWTLAFANDIDEAKYEMYSAQFADDPTHFHLGDIHELASKDVPTTALATASFPCNDLSLAGSRRGLGGKQSSAYWGFVRLLEGMEKRRPSLILLENVPGFLTSKGGRDIQAALLSLNQLGYLVDVLIIDAAHFVPQSRPRLFIVGHLQGERTKPDEVWETLGFYESPVRPKQLAEFVFRHPEIAWDIRPLPSLPSRSVNLESVIEDLPDDSPFWWNKKRRDYLVNQMSEKHFQQLQEMMYGAVWSYGTVFRRVRAGRTMAELRTDGLAGCLRTPRGGSARQILVQAGHGHLRVRLLTPRECAKLMGADDFPISVNLNKALFGFGDAVCVPVIEWISINYLSPLLEQTIRGTKAA